MKVEFIFVGRLEKEKGCDILLETIKLLGKTRKAKKSIHIHIFGKGSFEKEFQSLSKKYSFVTYHGFLPKKTVLKQRKKVHFTLMPSRFLETFGLSALDSLSVGVPVIGFQKGGLAQFVFDEHTLDEYKNLEKQSTSLKRKIQKIVKNFDQSDFKKYSKKAKKVYENYLWEIRINHFEQFKPSGTKRILLVSDYNQDIGGIENRLHIVSDNLKNAGYAVDFFGGSTKSPSKQGIFWNLFGTILNIPAALRLKKTVKQFNPDVIWRHSVHRVLGRFPVAQTSNNTSQQRIMYHDFGLFHPYPSMVYENEQIRKADSFWGFIKEGSKRGWYMFPLLCAKWLSFLIIRKQLQKNINLHLVPSSYMLSHVQRKGYIGKNAAIDLLPHFIDTPTGGKK